jgi:dipeptidyl aminopeptidase/acylaminoacyl peptidase
MANLRAAIALASRDEPAIDAKRLYTAGHSSAGAVALRGAATVPQIRGVVAYAPAVDPAARFGPDVLDAIEAGAPGIRALLARQPLAIAEKIRCPTMLFHAIDDETVAVDQTRQIAAKMKEGGNAPLVVEAPSGGHVQSMLLRGLEAGATWLADRAKRDAGK